MILINCIEWRPISFVDELIRAILADLKTETRRIMRVHPQWSFPPARYLDGFVYRWGPAASKDPKPERIACPYGKAGDRLWVRERFVAIQLSGSSPGNVRQCRINEADGVVFADGSIHLPKTPDFPKLPDVPADVLAGFRFRPPMHLPYWAYRIGLEVKSIKVERLQEITEEAAVAEGFQAWKRPESSRMPDKIVPARDLFRAKWNVINGKRKDHYSGEPTTWDFNPFVWVVNFKRIGGER